MRMDDFIQTMIVSISQEYEMTTEQERRLFESIMKERTENE